MVKKTLKKQSKGKSNNKQRDDSGAAFENNRKEKETHPDFTGQAMINGIEYWVSIWVKDPTGKATSEWLSLAFTPKNEQITSGNNFDHDVPF
jgi:hypothetical protein